MPHCSDGGVRAFAAAPGSPAELGTHRGEQWTHSRCRGLPRSARVPNDSGATLALGFADGRVEVHLLSPAVAASKGDAELEVLEALVAGAAIVK